MTRWIILAISHSGVLAAGFAAGVYLLPIISAPAAPDNAVVEALANSALYRGEFRRDLKGSDFLHWGEGQIAVNSHSVALIGTIAPGPAYILYLTPSFVEDEAGFAAVRDRALPLGEVNTFENFVVEHNKTVNLEEFDTVVIWCEAFSEFITAARYR